MTKILGSIQLWAASKGGWSHITAAVFVTAILAYAQVPAFALLVNASYAALPAWAHEVLLAVVGLVAWYKNNSTPKGSDKLTLPLTDRPAGTQK